MNLTNLSCLFVLGVILRSAIHLFTDLENGIELDIASDPLLGLENLGRRLILGNMSLDSTASFVCRASNPAGRTEFSHELIVYGESECIVCDYSFQ